MAPMDRAVVVAVPDLNSLIMAEMAEQATWSASIPAWHPRNDGSDAGDAGGKGSDGSGDGAGGNASGDDAGSGDGGDGGKTPAEIAAQAAVDAAYTKLRDAEKERDRYKADLTKKEREGLDELERTKQELADARAEAQASADKLAGIERGGLIKTLAATMEFKYPDKAAKFVPADATDEKSIKAALTETLKDFPELKGSAAPPPPINSDSKNNNGSENARMNAALRTAAGRQ
jgi:hypothetical protein